MANEKQPQDPTRPWRIRLAEAKDTIHEQEIELRSLREQIPMREAIKAVGKRQKEAWEADL